MNAKEVNVYEECDRQIKAMSRQNVESFGRLKMAKWDEVSIIRAVADVYRKSALQARKRYFNIAWEAYILGCRMCGIDGKTAEKMAKKAITMKWVDGILQQTDEVTLYRFESETERKAYRLAETLESSRNRNYEIDKAMKYWSQQLNQYAINFTDYAVIQAFQDAGVLQVEWVSERDMRVCNECYAFNGQRFLVTEIPPKPHWGCRCRVIPVLD